MSFKPESIMNLVELKAEIEVDPVFSKRTDQDWEDSICHRNVHVKFDGVIEHVVGCYVRKIPLLREMIVERGDPKGTLQAKIDRLMDKLACCEKEKHLRARKLVTRSPHNTDYYIDYVGGSDANTGLSTGQSWKTITQFTTTTVRSAGDRAFLRANVTWLQGTEAVDITFDEDGTIDSYIELIGADSVTNDPWGDASDVKPIVDFEDGAYRLWLFTDDFWRLDRLDFRRSNDALGAVSVDSCSSVILKDCVFRDGTTSANEGLAIEGRSDNVLLDGCSFQDTNGNALALREYCQVTAVGCTIDAGAVDGAPLGIDAFNGSRLDIYDSSIAPSNAFSSASIRSYQNAIVRMRNVTFGTETYIISLGGQVLSEDHDGTFESHITKYAHGDITRDTGTTRVGGASSSAKMEPNTSCGPNRPLILGDRLSGFGRPIWKAAGSYTATVYVRVGSAWDTPLTAAQCYLVTSELDNAGNATRVERTSVETIANNGDWTALTTSVSPAREGYIYFWVYLAEFEDATEHIFVDVLPTVV